ncbi:major facilitator superfamily domain-containing protein 8-like [Rhopilema esculentum]|uniref:major facilitator superfamily domain-containing protein 8-like n=1 Tax=Rhopilema esculentum TaxID=499914 RepID=UPI0031CDE123
MSTFEDVELPEDRKLRRRSIYVIFLITLFSSTDYAITMPSLWPYMKKIDQLVKPSHLGIANGGYCLGQLMGLPAFYAWHKIHGARAPLLACILLKFSAACLYALAAAFPGSNGLTMLIVAKFSTGFSSGQVVVCRTVLAHSTTVKEKKMSFAFLSTFEALGFAIGPGLSAFLAIVLKSEYRHSFIILDVFNAPGWLGMFMQTICYPSVLIWFKEYNLQREKENKTGELPKPDTFAMILVAISYFVIYVVFSALETLTAPLMLDELAFTKQTAVFNAGILLSSLGPIAFLSLGFIKCTSQRMDERQMVLVGCTIALLGVVTFLPWGNTYPTLQTNELIRAGNLTKILLKEGCPAKYHWCKNTPKIQFWQLIIAELITMIGFMLTLLIIYGLYSKVIGPRKQGFYIAAMSANSCLSGIISPLLLAYIYEHLGPRYVFITIASILSLFILVFTYFYSRLVPFEEYIKKN